MSTRAQLRAHLRRRLQETIAAQWTDSNLNDYLNLGLSFIQEEIETIYPETFLSVDTTDLIANQVAYALPINCKAPRRLRIKTAVGGAYNDLDQLMLDELYPDSHSSTTSREIASIEWSLEGQNIIFDPAPGVSVTAGIELTYVPVLVMGADDDVPDLPINLHYGITVAAQYVALQDTANSTDRQSVRDELNLIIARLPRHLQRSLAQRGGTLVKVPERIKFGGLSGGRFADMELKT